MSFMTAIWKLGEHVKDSRNSIYPDDIRDIVGLCEYPLTPLAGSSEVDEEPDAQISNDVKVLKKELRIGLDKELKGIVKIDIVPYTLQRGDELGKVKYLYRSYQGFQSWRWGPTYVMPVDKGIAKLKVEEQDARKRELWLNMWSEEKQDTAWVYPFLKDMFYPKSTFKKNASPAFTSDFEEFRKKNLIDATDDIISLWDGVTDTVLVFGVCENSKKNNLFKYPFEISSFVQYFKGRSGLCNGDSNSANENKEEEKNTRECAFCHALVDEDLLSPVPSEKFRFATFDKETFMPLHWHANKKMQHKPWPVCPACNFALSGVRSILDEKYSDRNLLYPLKLKKEGRSPTVYIIPEVIPMEYVNGEPKDKDKTAKYLDLLADIKNEGWLSKAVVNAGSSLIFHFLVLAFDQSQERILMTMENVPPSRLKRLEAVWHNTLKNFSFWNSYKSYLNAKFAKNNVGKEVIDCNDVPLSEAFELLRKVFTDTSKRHDELLLKARDNYLSLINGILTASLNMKSMHAFKYKVVSSIPTLIHDGGSLSTDSCQKVITNAALCIAFMGAVANMDRRTVCSV